MCRALLYLGRPVLLDNLLYQPDSALVRQSTMPRMLNLLNLAGFGLRAWDPSSHDPAAPFAYASHALPVFDRNLKGLAQKIRASCALAHVRGVAYSTEVEISLQNVHPFQFPRVPLAFAHNGDLARFRELKPLLAARVKPELAACVAGTTDSEWIYALLLSQLADPFARPQAEELVEALRATFAILRELRAELGIAISSPVNLFLTDGTQLAAVRYCFDFGCYETDAAGAALEQSLSYQTLNYQSLWYTAGREYGLHEGEWRMTGGAEHCDSLLVASEPLTRDIGAWVELPEYCVLHAEIRDGRPQVQMHTLD